MDDPRWEPGMPVLDRQAGAPAQSLAEATSVGATALPHPRPATALPPSLRDLPPRSVPETAPTPLQRHYVLLSVIPLLAGAVAITALEFGTALSSPLIKVCVLVGAPVIAVTTLDAMVRIWRSAWAWMPVNRGRGLFRLAWDVVAAVGLGAILWASALAVRA